MKVHFHKNRSIYHPSLEGQVRHCPKGKVQELPDELANHWFMKGLVKAGDVSIVEARKAVAPAPSKKEPESSEKK